MIDRLRKLGGPGILLAAGWATNIANLGFHALASRALGPARYAELAGVLAVLLIVSVPLSAVQAAVVQTAVAAPGSAPHDLLSRMARRGASFAVIGVLAAFPLAVVTGVHTPLGLALVGSWAGVAYLGAGARGVLLGRQSFRATAPSLVVSAFARVLLAWALVPALRVEGAMLATLVAEGVATIWTVALALRPVPALAGPHRPADLRPRKTDLVLALTAQMGVWSFAALPAVLANRMLAPDEAGGVAAASTVASMALFVTSAVGYAMFPRFAADRTSRGLLPALCTAIGLGGLSSIGILVAGPAAVRLLSGASFEVQRPVLVLLAVAAAATGVGAVAGQYLLARRHPGALGSWAGAVVAALVVLVTRPGPVGLTAVLATTAVLTTAGVCVVAIRTPFVRVERRGLELIDEACPLSIVVPSYNGGRRLRPFVEILLRVVERAAPGSEVIVVIDGSTDGSERHLEGLPVRLEVLPLNLGKGAALRHGFERARGALVGFIDGDGDIDPGVIERLARALDDPGVWAATASKRTEGAECTLTRRRRVMSSAYRAIVRSLFDLDLGDTQCGAKLFRREALREVLPWSRERRFALDVELLALGSRLRIGEVREVPVRLHRDHDRSSAASLRSALVLAADTARVWSRVVALPQRTADELVDSNASSPDR